MNIICVKQGDKYSSDYVNRLYYMCCKYIDESFAFHCYTDNDRGLDEGIYVTEIDTDSKGVWCKLDLFDKFTTGTNIYFDLDVVLLRPPERLLECKSNNLMVLYSAWKEGFLKPSVLEKHQTLYNSSVMKWVGEDAKHIYDYYQQHKTRVTFIYKGIDRFLFNEPIEVHTFQTGIAYSYHRGANYNKDNKPAILRPEYEVVIFNEGIKQDQLTNWVKDYWNVSL